MNAEKMWEEFELFWNASEQAELRASCAQGWAFRVWQASRAALVVELPETSLTGSIGVAHKAVTKRCREAIESAGIKVK